MKLKPLMGLTLCAALAGCGSSEVDDLKVWMDEQSASMVGKVEKLDPVQQYDPFIYDAFALVDPFSTSKMEVAKARNAKKGGIAPDSTRPKEPLEAYDLEKLSMKGTLMKKGGIVAIIQTPDKSTYSAKVGSFMGQNFGVITKITETEITLKETVEDSSGEWVERITTLPLEEQERTK